ncbi:glutaredoxin 3 [Sphingomonas piscis]|uniref:Glutaredoxin n=1 Tax=Sphingomonas piscis TaxID=2714943 RepID=A0A6G7YMI3_9SPHN|nr:glutaredoxin 3 [Sphingomonas piscis]QIK77941.1 glutaredoxin 3 [Sphingomonas piscis]
MTEVEIYTKFTCPYCIRAKRLLDSKGIEYREIKVDRGGAEKEEMVQRANGRTTVPQIFIGGQHVGGCDDLMALEYEGRLDGMLAA